MMGQSVEQCACEALGAEGFGPFLERQIVLVIRVEPRS